MNIPLTIIYALIAISLLITAHVHGRDKGGKYNFWITLVNSSLTLLLIWWALDWKFF